MKCLRQRIFISNKLGQLKNLIRDDEIREWWKRLDTVWKNIFKYNLDINHSPSLLDIKGYLV